MIQRLIHVIEKEFLGFPTHQATSFTGMHDYLSQKSPSWSPLQGSPCNLNIDASSMLNLIASLTIDNPNPSSLYSESWAETSYSSPRVIENCES